MISRQPWLAVLIAVASAMSVVACDVPCPDNDSDGVRGDPPPYGFESNCIGGNDCDDDPDDDPPVCYTCTCGEAGCSACARCINPDAQEGPLGDPTCADGLDNDCDELTDSEDNGCRQCASADECDDGNPCTDDACVSFLCEYPYNEDPCDDGDPCTTNDACSQGVCGGELPDADGDTYVPDSCGGNDCDDDDGDDPPTCLTCSCGEAECAACARCINPGLEEGPRAEPPCRDCVDNDCDGSPDGADSGCAPESPYDGAFAVNYTLNWHNCYPMPLLDESVEITVQEATILISVDDPCLTASGTWNEANSQGSGTSPWSCQTPGPPPGCEPCQKMTLNITFTDTDNFNGTCLFDAIFDPYCGQSLCIAEYTVSGVRSSP